MIDIFESFYLRITNNRFIKGNVLALVWVIVTFCLNLIAPIYFHFTRNHKNYKLKPCLKENNRIIISVTSFPLRIKKLWVVIETILRQSQKPDKLILWLSLEQFSSIDILPKKIVAQVKRGLEIRFVNEDIKSFKKFYYSFQEFPQDYILTIDDDIFYESHLIENIINLSKTYKNSIIAAYCKKINWNSTNLSSYSSWPLIKEKTTPNYQCFFGTGGGTLFPPNSLDHDIFKKDLFLNLSPTADDIWINTMCRLNNTPIACTGQISCYFPVKIKSNKTLDSLNNGMNQNDIQLGKVINYYIKNRNINPFKN